MNQDVTVRSCAVRVRFGPAGIHVFDRVSGLNVLLDEVIPDRGLWTTAPRQVSFALTNTCDLACSHCYAPKSFAALTFESVTAWLSELDLAGTVGIGFGGGEPTLHRRFADLCCYAATETRVAVTFTTHGHHLTDSLLQRLQGFVHFVRVSVDGVNATYEAVRQRSFRALRERLYRLREVAPFGINFVVNSQTCQDLDAGVVFAEDAGAAEFLLLPEQPVNGRGGISPAAAVMMREWTRRYNGPVRLTISARGAEGIATCDPFAREPDLRGYAHVDANGILKRSSYDTQGVAVGPNGIMSALTQLQAKRT